MQINPLQPPTQPGIIPVQPSLNPFTPDDKELLLKIVGESAKHLDLIQRAEEAGLDLGEQKQRAIMHRDVASKLLEKFFPGTIYPTAVE